MKIGNKNISWMTRGHVKEVAEIESRSFAWALDADDIRDLMRTQNRIALVHKFDGRVVGYVFYDAHQKNISIVRIAVDPDYRRCGIGTAMVRDVINRTLGKESHKQRRFAHASVSESHVAGQLLLRSCGFSCFKIVESGGDWIEGDNTEDSFVFQYDTERPYTHVSVIEERRRIHVNLVG